MEVIERGNSGVSLSGRPSTSKAFMTRCPQRPHLAHLQGSLVRGMQRGWTGGFSTSSTFHSRQGGYGGESSGKWVCFLWRAQGSADGSGYEGQRKGARAGLPRARTAFRCPSGSDLPASGSLSRPSYPSYLDCIPGRMNEAGLGPEAPRLISRERRCPKARLRLDIVAHLYLQLIPGFLKYKWQSLSPTVASRSGFFMEAVHRCDQGVLGDFRGDLGAPGASRRGSCELSAVVAR